MKKTGSEEAISPRSNADQSLKCTEVQSVKKVQEMLRGDFEDVEEEELFYSMVFTVRLENNFKTCQLYFLFCFFHEYESWLKRRLGSEEPWSNIK